MRSSPSRSAGFGRSRAGGCSNGGVLIRALQATIPEAVVPQPQRAESRQPTNDALCQLETSAIPARLVDKQMLRAETKVTQP